MNSKLFSAALFTALSTAANAQDKEQPFVPNGWYVQLGPAYIAFDEDATIDTPAGTIPGANAEFENNFGVGLGIGYQFSEKWSAIFIFGTTPTTTVTGTGTLAGTTVGDIKYGPSVLALNYHIPTNKRFKPFVGAGLNYTKIFSTEDGAITNLEADDTFGFVLRAGFDYEITERHGLFFSANKVFASSTARGNAPGLGGAPVTADIDLDPLILHTGWSFKF